MTHSNLESVQDKPTQMKVYYECYTQFAVGILRDNHRVVMECMVETPINKYLCKTYTFR